MPVAKASVPSPGGQCAQSAPPRSSAAARPCQILMFLATPR